MRGGPSAAITVGRYSHARQFKRARRARKFLLTQLGWIIRNITRKTAEDWELVARFTPLLDRALRARMQDHRQRGHKIYSLHAPEAE
jgi:IS5 family transposase